MSVSIRYVRPGLLRLPPDRAEGADLFKLIQQQAEFGSGQIGMPPLEATEGAGGELMINNGVTRAARCFSSNPDAPVPVQVIDTRAWDFRHLPTVAEAAGADALPFDEEKP